MILEAFLIFFLAGCGVRLFTMALEETLDEIYGH